MDGYIRAPVIRALYDAAEQIFFNSVSRTHSRFPLALGEEEYAELARVFGGGDVAKFPRRGDSAGDKGSFAVGRGAVAGRKRGSKGGFVHLPDEAFRHREKYNARRPPTPPRKDDVPLASYIVRRGPDGRDSGSEFGEPVPIIPPSFDKSVFDKAEKRVWGIVLENTWIRYVDSLSLAEQLIIEERALTALDAAAAEENRKKARERERESSLLPPLAFLDKDL